MQFAISDARGFFLVQHLLPGDYRICADTRQPCPANALTTTVEAGATAEVTLDTVGAPASSQPAAGAFDADPQRAELLNPSANDAANAADRDDQATATSADESQPRRDTAQADGQASVSFAGLSPIEDVALLDGLSQRQGYRAGIRGAAAGGPRASSAFDEGAVRGLRTLPRSFSAQYGAAGTVLAAVSRRADDHPHGSAFLSLRNAVFAATNPFSLATHYRDGVVTSAAVKPQGSADRFGGSLGFAMPPGAPRLARPLHLFGSVETQLQRETLVSTPFTAPGESSFFSLTPIQRALLSTRGVSPAATNTALNYLDSLTGDTQRSATHIGGLVRADFNPASHDSVSATYTGTLLDAPRGASLGQVSGAVVARGRGSIGDSEVRINAVSGRWLHLFSPRWSTELRGQVAHDLEYETPHAPLPQEPGIGLDGYAPQVSIAESSFSFGTPASLGRNAYPDEQRLQLAASTQVLRGRQLFLAGADWSRLHDRVAFTTNNIGSFDYDSGLTGGAGVAGPHAGGLVDWITDATYSVNAYPNGGCPNIGAAVHYFCFRSFTQSFGGEQTQFVTHEIAAFTEDTIFLRSGLTLTLGARWDYTLLPPPQSVNTALDAELGSLGLAGGTSGRIPEDRNNYGPRFGLTWSPGGASSWLRGTTFALGAGSFFGQVPGATVRAALAETALPSSIRRIRITPLTVTLCPQVAGQGFGYPCTYTAEPPLAVAQTTSAVVFARSFRLPAVHRAMLSMERTVGHGLTFHAAYATAMALQLPSSSDLNILPSTGLQSFILQGGDGRAGVRDGETFAVPLYTARRFTDYGPITAIQSHANATYHAATVQARWIGNGALRGLLLRGSYAFSRSIDDAPQQGATPRTDSQFDPFVNGYDKGLSTLHFPHRFSGDAVVTMHLSHGPIWLRTVAGGWRAAAIGTAGSGRPYTYQVFGGTRLSGGRESINGSGGATYLPTIGRNTRHMSSQGVLDLRFSRDVAAGGRLRLNLFAEAYNALNTRNIAAVETRAYLVGTAASATAPIPLIFQDAATVAAEGIATPAFGQPTSSTTGLSRERQIAVGARLNF